MNSRFVPYTAAGGGIAWAIAFLAGTSAEAGWTLPVILLALILLLLAHPGLQQPNGALLPAVAGGALFATGAVLSIVDVAVLGIAGWNLMWIGFLVFVGAEVIVAARAFASGRTQRAAAAAIGLGAALQAIGLIGMMTGFLTSPVLAMAGVPLFAGGWIWLGLAPLVRRAAVTSLGGGIR